MPNSSGHVCNPPLDFHSSESNQYDVTLGLELLPNEIGKQLYAARRDFDRKAAEVENERLTAYREILAEQT